MRYRQVLWIGSAAVVTLTATANLSLAQTSDGQTLLLSSPIPGVEQAPAPSVSTGRDPLEPAERMAALQAWTREYSEWKEWEERWRGRLQPGWFGFRERRTKPDPPRWLFDECRELDDLAGTLADACLLLTEWKDDHATAQARTRTLNARADREASTRTTWWNHVHLDALWLTPNASVSYGVVGVHVTVKVVGRWQVLSRRAACSCSASEHAALNLARAWLMGGSESFLNSSVDLVGLSLTFT